MGARKMLKKVMKGHNVTLIKAAKQAVRAAERVVITIVKKSAKIVKHDLKHLHKQAKKLKVHVSMKFKCHAEPKVKKIVKKRKLVKKPISKVLEPLKRMLELN